MPKCRWKRDTKSKRDDPEAALMRESHQQQVERWAKFV